MASTGPILNEKTDRMLTLENVFQDADLGGCCPRAHKFSPDGSRVTYLLGRPENAYQTDLWEYSIALDRSRRLVDSAELFCRSKEQTSGDEWLRRERARAITAKGIYSYSANIDGDRILFPFAGELYLYRFSSNNACKLGTEGGATDACFSPQGRYVSYVLDRNITIMALDTGVSRQLTTEGGGTISWGLAEFVAQEEFERMTGYWWSPNDRYVAAARVDESAVLVTRRCEIFQTYTSVAEQRYPAAGGENAIVELALLPVAAEEPMKWLDLGQNKDYYVVRVEWLPDSTGLIVQRLARDQRTLDVLLYRLTDKTSLRATRLLVETSTTWVNVHSCLRPLAGGAFIWANERTGFRHLYYCSSLGKMHPLTSGQWVVDEVVGINESARLVYFTANKDSPLEQHLYCVDMGGETVTRLSQGGGWHEISFNQNGTVYVDTWSTSPRTPLKVGLFNCDGKLLKLLSANDVDPHHPLYPFIGSLPEPEYGTIVANDGTELFYQLLRPLGMAPGKRYPVHLKVYGGPNVQWVQRRWSGRSFLVDCYMAQRGFVVFMLDNRGTARRGKAFEEHLHMALGHVEVCDQLAGIAFLKSLSFVDPTRIGVFGWSYGGYMALNLLAKAPDQLVCGVAVAPVTDWLMYDTAYTERYMGSPVANAQFYRQASVLTHLDGVRSGSLLLMHGMADDNVLFAHTTNALSALQKRNCQFRFMAYPGERHTIASAGPRLHVWTEITQFFIEMLGDHRVRSL